MLFSELHKIMVNKVTFVAFRGVITPPGSALSITFSWQRRWWVCSWGWAWDQ